MKRAVVIAAWIFVVCAAIALVRGSHHSIVHGCQYVVGLLAGVGLSLPRLFRLVLWPVGMTVVLPASGLVAAMDILGGQRRARMTAVVASALGILMYCGELRSRAHHTELGFVIFGGNDVAIAMWYAFNAVVPVVCVCAWLACLILFAANRRCTSRVATLRGVWRGRTVSRVRAVMLGLPAAWIFLDRVPWLARRHPTFFWGVVFPILVETAVLLAFAFVVGRVVFAVERSWMAREPPPQ
jgi:hypothetical protein